jgi:dimeric dUTPase (all-alpha-NTP-PPase superfamily)
MNLNQLFEAQKEFRNRINYNESDRLNKLILALQVELGECANELPEVFKFWSKKKKNNYEKALMEYVDGLHFVLEIGIEHEFDKEVEYLEVTPLKLDDIVYQFTELMRADWYMYDLGGGGYFHEGLELYLGLGEMIGFTSEQIHAAYFAKNQINHARQDAGY